MTLDWCIQGAKNPLDIGHICSKDSDWGSNPRGEQGGGCPQEPKTSPPLTYYPISKGHGIPVMLI